MDELELQLEETKLQLEETKLQLTDKLGTLEQQVSDTVESAGAAVTATVEAVQGTVESVTEAFEDTVHSVSNAFDLQRQIEKHPFLVVGGAVVVGYLAAEFLKKAPRYEGPAMVSFEEPIRHEPAPHRPVDTSSPPVQQAVPVQQPRPTPPQPSAWDSLRTLAISTLLGSVQGIVLRAVPEVVGFMVGNMMGDQMRPSQESQEQAAHRARIWPDDLQQFPKTPSAEHVRSSKLS